MQTTDVSAGGYGLPWSHTRTYSNQMQSSFDRGNGWNWNPEDWPYLINSPFPNSTYAMLGNLYDIDWFQYDSGSNTYTTLFGRLKVLTHDATNSVFRLLDADGTVTVFNDMTHATRPGLFKSITTPGGNTLTVNDSSGTDILEVQRSYVSGSDTITESFLYDFFDSGIHLGRLERVTLRRNINGGSWQNVLKAEYTYYGSSSNFGSLNDLEAVTRYEWDGSAWQQLDVNYYRYWKQGDTNGFEHGLKYLVGPNAYQNMLNDSLNPLTVTDAQLAVYADNYFEYDGNKRVTTEIADAGSLTFTFAYTDNPNTFPDTERRYNFWWRKTVETRPDSSQRIVYANRYGQSMLEILKSGTDEWLQFTKYDGDGRVILEASPSAITGYDDTYNDLLHEDVNGDYQYLRDSAGLISIREFYTTTGSGAAAGYLQCAKIKQGQNGTEIKLREYEYTSHSANGDTIFPISKEIIYPDESNQTTTIETSYSYTFYTGTTQIEQKTTTLPVISTSQNGSGTANTFVDVFDEYNNLIWHKDERGFITRYKYDIETGAMTQQIDDVDTAQVTDEPSGWTTPTGGGLHLVTDYDHDDQGRITQSLGPVHTIDLNGTATAVRTAQWTVYKDSENTTISAQGFYETAADADTLVNPVSISITDRNGNLTDSIQATRSSTSGKLQPTDSFPQSSYVRWTTNQYTECCKLISTRVYHTIPASGTGANGTNYDQTDYGYDSLDRQNRTTSPGGTITYTVFDVRSLPEKVYVGTDDTGATDTDPTGGGATGNNMVLVTQNQYDAGTDGGDGNLTSQTQSVDASATRVTTFGYDWRNRQTTIDGEIDYFQKVYYDNLDRVMKVERYDTTAAGNLIGRQESKFDDLSRVYETASYGVNPATGSVGNSLTGKTWYDAVGNVIKQLPSGSKLFTKSVYDGLSRPTKQYVGYDTSESTYADAGTVTGDTVFEQTESTYDAASNVIQVTARQRFHNATGTGELGTPTSTEPKARVSYSAAWQDGIGRVIASADYGTNGGSTFTRPSTVPSRSDSILVSTATYDDTGEAESVIDPAGTKSSTEYDDAGRPTKVIENVQPASSSSSSSSSGGSCSPSADTNRTTVTTYNADGNVATLVAWNAVTGDQTTTYVYGTTLTDSEIATSTLLRRVKYPDSTGDSDSVEYKYNRQTQITEMKDQNGTVHSYDYDALGRPTQDRVTTLGTNVDGAIRRIASTYDVRGLQQNITSYDNATVGAGSIVNDVQFAYNDFGQRTTSYQAHGGAVNTSTTPKVQYAYADGSANTIRPTSITYPNGRAITYNYGTSSGKDDNASRIFALVDDDGGSTHLADYEYLGLSTVVEVDDTEPDVRYTLFDTGVSGDIYTGLDRFSRIVDSRWYDYGASQDAARIKYGYNRDSSRLWREDTVAAGQSKHFDELYAYDGLQRLKDMQRGSLNTPKDAVTNKQFAQCWSLDETGNWDGFRTDDNGDGTWNLIQARTANTVNEITNITETTGPSWVTPSYDAAGNMTTVPQPADPTASYAATYDAWNRLVKIVDGSDTVQEGQYDGRHYRIVVKNYVSGSLDETRHIYFTDGWQAIEERVDSSTDPDRQFVWGLRYIDDIILRDRDTTGNGTLDERLYALQDGNWNVIAITDENGDVQERYAYDAYGHASLFSDAYSILSTSFWQWEHLFAGYLFEGGTALYTVRSRSLCCVLGTWIERDPVEYFDGMSQYQYVGSNPLSYIDPSGLGKGKAIGWVVRRVGGKLVKVQAFFTEKQAARLFLGKAGRSGLDILVRGGRGGARKVANAVRGAMSAEQLGRAGRILWHGGHAIRNRLGRAIGTGVRHAQFNGIANRHIFYGLALTALTAATVDAAESRGCKYELDVSAVYNNPRPGESFANAFTISHWAGEDSVLSYGDWVNPGELLALGGDAARWMEREMEKRLIGVSVTVRKVDGQALATYSFDSGGELISVGRYDGGNSPTVISGSEFLKQQATGSEPLALWMQDHSDTHWQRNYLRRRAAELNPGKTHRWESGYKHPNLYGGYSIDCKR